MVDFKTDKSPPVANVDVADAARQRFSTEANTAATKPSAATDNGVAQGAAASIRQATKRDNFIDTGTDEKKIFSVLSDLTEKDLDALKIIYKTRYKIDIVDEMKREMSGSDLDRALNLLNRKDNKTDNAGFFHENLLENKEWFGRSRVAVAKAIRDKLSSMTASEIQEADTTYKSRYGIDLKTAIKGGGFDGGTVDLLDTYFKGKDRRTAGDTAHLIDVALKARNIEMFQEAMRDSTAEERDSFMRNGGENRIKKAFEGHWYNAALNLIPLAPHGNVRDTILHHAEDFAQEGHFKVATLVKDNTSVLGDNEVAIESALSQLNDQERTRYLVGRHLSAHSDEKTPDITDKERQDSIKFYRELHDALHKAGNKTEMLMWEDQIEYKGGSLVTRLGRHNGVLVDSPMDDVLSTIETMTEREWTRLKSEPEYATNVRAVLSTYLNRSELQRASELLNRKIESPDFEKSKASANRPVIDVIKDNTHRGFLWLDNKEDNIYKAIEKMSPEEMEKYRTNPSFRKQLDDIVRNSLDVGAEREVANSLLQKIIQGQPPKQTIIEKLAIYGTSVFGDKSKVVREVEKAFREQPELFERQKNPKTKEDQEFSDRFRKNLRAALGSDNFLIYGESLLNDGSVSLQQHIQMNKGIFGLDEKGMMQTLAVLPEDQRKQLLANDTGPGAHRLLFNKLTKEEQQLAKNIAEQGEERLEDKLRAYVLGDGGDQQDTMKLLQGLSQEEKTRLCKVYAEKYDANATADLLDQLKKKERDKAELMMEHIPKTTGEQINQGIFLYSKARDGAGSRLVDKFWDGTGFQTDNGLNQLITTLAPRDGGSPTAARRQEVRNNLVNDLSNFRDSREKLAEVATDAGIAILAVGGAYFTGGASLGLLAKIGIAGTVGATIKLGGKAAIMGSEYDWSKRQMFADGGRGFVSGALAYLGSTWVAKAFGVGDAAGAQASNAAIARLAQLAEEGGHTLLRDGANEAITSSFQNIIRHAIMAHSMKVPVEAVKALATEVAMEGSEDAVNVALTSALSQALAQQATHVVTNLGIEYGVTAASGGIGGGGSGTISGISDWDPRKSLDQNLVNLGTSAGTSALVGITSAVVHKTAFKAIGFGYEQVQSLLDPEFETGDGMSKISRFRIRPVLPQLLPHQNVDVSDHRQIRIPFRSIISEQPDNMSVLRRPVGFTKTASLEPEQ